MVNVSLLLPAVFMAFLYLKALHIVFVVTWFSGLFYLCRLMVYNREAGDREDGLVQPFRRQFNLMISRLQYGICWPSALLTWITGLSLLHYYLPALPVWLWMKLLLVLVLTAYHTSLQVIQSRQKSGDFGLSGNALRIWNEVPTVLLVGIVFLVVVKQGISLLYGAVGLAAFILLLLGAIRIYRNFREAGRDG